MAGNGRRVAHVLPGFLQIAATISGHPLRRDDSSGLQAPPCHGQPGDDRFQVQVPFAPPQQVENDMSVQTFTAFRVSVLLPAATALAAILTAAVAGAQAFHAEIRQPAGAVLAEAPAPSSPETVRLLTGLAKIQSDLMLGLLFLQDGMTSAEGSHFTHPRAETYPGLKDGLIAAGIADFEPQLVALEAGGSKDTQLAAYAAANGAIMQARSALRPSDRDVLQSIVEQARAMAAEINPSGPTEAANYQDAWAMVMVARSQVDFLLFSQDSKVAAAARKMALALDDVIISLPDPNVSTPVEVDATLILDAVGALEGLAGSV
jgi:hypothetical protein